MVDIEEARRPKAQTTEGLIVRQSPAEMADAGDADFPMLLQSDDFYDLLTQFTDIITDTFFPKSTEAGKVLSNLFRCDA